MQKHSEPLAPLVRKLLNNGPLDEDEQAAILTLPYAVREFEAGRHVVREGDLPTHCCALLKGFAIRHKIVADGGRQILNLHVPGDMMDLQNWLLPVSDHNVQALTAMTVALIPREAVDELAFAQHRVARALMRETLIEGAIVREWLANVGRRDSKTRIGHLLCEFAQRLEAIGLAEECNYELPMTQEQIGDAVGLTSVHVNRTLKALEAEGLIKRTKRSLTIANWRRLAEAADFRPLYLHLPAELQ